MTELEQAIATTIAKGLMTAGYQDAADYVLSDWMAGAISRATGQLVPAPVWQPTHRHVKRGTEYRLIGTARIQSEIPLVDDSEVEIYVGKDGDLWARRKIEFHDGRFVPTAPASEDV